MEPVINEPEFCPNPNSRCHPREVARRYQWYCRFGSLATRCRGEIQRFRCTACGKTCSTQTFSVHYRTHSTKIWRGCLVTSTAAAGYARPGGWPV